MALSVVGLALTVLVVMWAATLVASFTVVFGVSARDRVAALRRAAAADGLTAPLATGTGAFLFRPRGHVDEVARAVDEGFAAGVAAVAFLGLVACCLTAWLLCHADDGDDDRPRPGGDVEETGDDDSFSPRRRPSPPLRGFDKPNPLACDESLEGTASLGQSCPSPLVPCRAPACLRTSPARGPRRPGLHVTFDFSSPKQPTSVTVPPLASTSRPAPSASAKVSVSPAPGGPSSPVSPLAHRLPDGPLGISGSPIASDSDSDDEEITLALVNMTRQQSEESFGSLAAKHQQNWEKLMTKMEASMATPDSAERHAMVLESKREAAAMQAALAAAAAEQQRHILEQLHVRLAERRRERELKAQASAVPRIKSMSLAPGFREKVMQRRHSAAMEASHALAAMRARPRASSTSPSASLGTDPKEGSGSIGLPPRAPSGIPRGASPETPPRGDRRLGSFSIDSGDL